jgi:hypothetical protein
MSLQVFKFIILILFEFAASIMNRDVNGKVYSKFNSPNSKQCFILLSCCLVFIILVSHWSEFTNLSRMWIIANLTHYPTHEGGLVFSYASSWCGRQICHLLSTSFRGIVHAKQLHEENSITLPSSGVWNVEFWMCLAITIHIRDRSVKFEWIQHEVLKNLKSL